MQHPHVLLVEDDELTRNLLKAYLEKEAFVVSCAASGQQMLVLADKQHFDLILLDLGLPDEDGLTLARQMRGRSPVPMIVLTARPGHDDRIAALAIGVDDYLTKPFDPLELVLRARNLLDRGSANTGGTAIRHFAGWVFDAASRGLTASDGRAVILTRSEFNLLAALVLAPRRVLNRAQLLDALTSNSDAPNDRAVDVTVSRLRRKIEADPREPSLIVTVPGYGYMLAADVS